MLKQASEEFEARGLVVKTASSRAELMEQFRNNQAQEGNTGKPEITVVNIQRFAEDRSKVDLPAYATNLQRVFIIDEAHRGYKPEIRKNFLQVMIPRNCLSMKQWRILHLISAKSVKKN